MRQKKFMSASVLHQVWYPILAWLFLTTGCHGNSGVCPAANTGWVVTQAPDVGVCLYTQTEAARSKYSYSDTQAQCNAATSTAGLTSLPTIDSEIKKVSLLNVLFKNAFGYNTVWTAARCRADMIFEWTYGLPVAPSIDCPSASSRLYFSASMTPDYSFVSSFVVTNNASLLFIPVCEYSVPQCNPESITGYEIGSMMPSVIPYANTTVRINCAPGFYRPSDIVITPSGTIDKVANADKNLFYCLFTPSATGGAGTVQFVQIGAMNTLEACQPSSCPGWQLLNTTIIPDVEDYKSLVNGSKNYRFNEAISLVCRKGYVSVDDYTLTTTQIVCGQSDLNPSLGMWTPTTLVVCTPLQCLDPMPFYDAEKMFAYSAYDRLKDRKYTSDESNRFPYYPREVSIKCRHDGLFFMDRTYDKALKCDLPGNGTNNTAVWFPFGGTVLSPDIMKCQPITCLVREIVIITQQNDLLNYLLRSNFFDGLVVTDPEGNEQTLTIRDFTTSDPLKFQSKVRFNCLSNYQMSVQGENGQSQLTNSTEVTCASSGTWSFRVASCIKQTESLSVTSASGKYVPPAQEAAGAESLGLIVIIILVVFFGTILILDLTTIARDVKLMRTNLRRIKLKLQMRKQA